MRAALGRVKCGTPAVDVCRELGITQTTFYRWRARLEGSARAGERELRLLREENDKLRHIVAELLLDKQASVDARRRK